MLRFIVYPSLVCAVIAMNLACSDVIRSKPASWPVDAVTADGYWVHLQLAPLVRLEEVLDLTIFGPLAPGVTPDEAA